MSCVLMYNIQQLSNFNVYVDSSMICCRLIRQVKEFKLERLRRPLARALRSLTASRAVSVGAAAGAGGRRAAVGRLAQGLSK